MSENSRQYGSITDETSEEEPVLPYTISDILNQIGFGKFHIVISFMTILSGIGDGSEIMLLTILPLVLEKEWSLTQYQSSFLMSIVFVGLIISFPLFGYVTSKIGRKKVIIISSIMLTIASLLSVVSINIYMMLTCRFLVGFAYGGNSQIKTYTTEFMPMNFRLLALYMSSFGYIGGIFYTTLMAYLTLNAFSWRIWLLVSMIPSGVFCLFSFFLYETPFYLLQKERSIDAIDCINKISKINKSPIPENFELIKAHESDRSVIPEFFSKKNMKINLILMFTLTASGITYYGFSILANSILAHRKPPENSMNHEVISQAALRDILITTSCEIPGTILCFLCSHFIGRKFTFLSFYGLATLSFLIMMFIKSNIWLVVFTAITRSFNTMPSHQGLNYIVEFYPTETRPFAYGFLTMFYRVGGLLSPFIIGMFHGNVFNVLLFYTVSTFFCCVFSFGFVETKNRPTE